MRLTELFLADLEREAASSRRVLERVPEGRNDWKPHPKSMPLGYLASLTARLPGWIGMMVNRDEFDLNGAEAAAYKPQEQSSKQQLLQVFEEAVSEGRKALASTSDEHLMKPWKFVVGGHVVSELPRHIMIRDAVFSHMAHHLGQLTVYLRLNDAKVPAIYGPSADEGNF